jgi:hypothetical protein
MATNSQISQRINPSAFLALQATFLNYDDSSEATSAYLTELALKINCARITVGIIEENAIKIIGISHDSNKLSDELNQLLTAAIDECIAQSTTLKYPTDANEQPKIVLSQSALSQFSSYPLVTIPLADKGVIYGAMVFELDHEQEREDDEITTLNQVAALFSPLLILKLKAKQSIFGLIKTKFKDHWKRINHANGFPIKLAFSSLAILLVGFSLFVPITHHVGAPARLEGLIQRALVAPEDGFLKQTYVRPGDFVKENQVLAELADQDLTLVLQQKQSEFTQYQNAYGAALAGSDRVQLMINQSKMDEIKSQLLLIQQKLERTKLTAPFDGVVIKGDLKQTLGAPVQKGDVLITVAPKNAFRLIVEVDERDIDLLAVNQKGLLALVSLPDKRISFEVTNISPVANAKEGRNFFEIEARVLPENSNLNLQPGMEGVAKITAGKSTIFWKISHRFIDWARLTLWSWGW